MGHRRWKQRTYGSQPKDAAFYREYPSPGCAGRFLTTKEPFGERSFESVPDWEKRFCNQMKWKDFCEKKSVIIIFPKVLDWDDSAGKEAFNNAKARYWAEINNLPCKIPLPDPNMYTQEVDYDAFIDPSLLEDLYVSPPPPPETPDLNSIKIVPTGWDVVIPSPTDNIPEFIYIKSSTPDEIVDSSTHDKRYGRSGGDRSFSLSHANLRCHEQGYQQDVWATYLKEQYFWRQETRLDNGLSCTPGNH